MVKGQEAGAHSIKMQTPFKTAALQSVPTGISSHDPHKIATETVIDLHELLLEEK